MTKKQSKFSNQQWRYAAVYSFLKLMADEPYFLWNSFLYTYIFQIRILDAVQTLFIFITGLFRSELTHIEWLFSCTFAYRSSEHEIVQRAPFSCARKNESHTKKIWLIIQRYGITSHWLRKIGIRTMEWIIVLLIYLHIYIYC